MKRRLMSACAKALMLFVFSALSDAQTVPLPVIRQNGQIKQLLVDGKPFIALAGELHNSTASSIEYMQPIFDHLAALHLNTVISTVSWELIEPQESRFDFSLVDAQINDARKRNMRLILVWFGTFKTANASYVPEWVKADRKRFPPMVFAKRPDRPTLFPLGGLSVGEGGIGALTPFGEETLRADAKAFQALMRHIRDYDPQHTVIMMQVENEPGSFGDSRDRSPLAEAAWQGPVPPQFLTYLVQNKDALVPEFREIWVRNGSKTRGTWAEVFGNDERADEIFMGYYSARFVGQVAKAGKAELNLPMFVNAFLVIPGLKPGQFPSGGPVHRLLNVYQAAAPELDALSPNAYSPDFKNICALYTRAGNPLLIAETTATIGNLFWAVGHYAALVWSPFGSVETLPTSGQLGQAYQILDAVLPELTKWQADRKVDAILVADGEEPKPLSLGGYKITLAVKARRGAAQPSSGKSPQPAEPGAADLRPFAIVVHSAANEFLLIGANGVPRFAADSPGPSHVAIVSKEEGHYENGRWTTERRLNGDEVDEGLPDSRIGMLRIKLLRFE